MARSNTACFFDVDGAVSFDIEGRGFTAQALRHQFHLQLVVTDFKHHFLEEDIEDFSGGVMQCAQDDTGRQLTTTVNTDEQVIFRVKLKVEP